MARTQPDDQWHENDKRQEIRGWQELRSDLLGLLQEQDRVRTGSGGSSAAGYTPDEQAFMDDADLRHRQALRSVAETMQRFSSRRNPEVDTAIAQIRGRREDAPSRRPERLSQFQDRVNDMSARLERLGGELRDTRQSPTGMREIADQVSQLTNVVEVLAGAVGESGQVKRLEAQIAQLTKLIGRDQQQPDGNGVSERLDRLAAAVDHMSNAQREYAQRPLEQLDDLQHANQSSFTSIEDGVRNIYDRIDSLEQNLSLNPAEVDKLTQEMATISSEMSNMNQAMKAGGNTSNSLLQRIDALNARVGQIEGGSGGHGDVGGLKADITALRDSVREMVEPRFSALKDQLDSLDERIAQGSGRGDITPAQLEGQIRQLIARMDQTGEQLADIRQMYAEGSGGPSAGGSMPDIDALADAIVRRTGSSHGASGGAVELSSDNLDELEARLSKLFGAVGSGVEAGSFEELQHSIKRVDDRLSRLEATLSNDLSARDTQMYAAPQTSQWEQPAGASSSRHPVEVESAPRATSYAPRLDDAMDTNPADEQPLVDRGFSESFDQETDFESLNASDDYRGETQYASTGSIYAEPQEETPEAAASFTDFDPDAVDRPAKPKSSLFTDDEPAFMAEPAASKPEEAAPRSTASATSRNTFIEAARRAAQRQDEADATNAQSIIARALNRFQSGDQEVPAPRDEPVVAKEPSRAEKKAAAKAEKSARAQMKAEAAATPRERMLGDEEEPKQSFIARHRRVLLLSAALVTISLLAFNLIEKRANEGNGTIFSAPVETPAPEPMAAPAEPAPTPEIDNEPTGSIDPFVRMEPDRPVVMTQSLPSMLSDAPTGMPDQSFTRGFETGSIAPDADAPVEEEQALAKPASAEPSPVRLELPPENMGPLALREAAANGDARAQFEIGAIYSEGEALQKDVAEAAKWYERSAAQGFAPAEYRLGNLYENGEGVDKDLVQAKLWYQRAAEAGNRMAMHNLAALYASGELGKQEFSLAAEWFERAAARGLTDSQFNLGMLYARGLGVPQNMGASYKWFSLAAMRGDEGAVKARDDIAKSLDAETMASLKLEIADWEADAIDIAANFAPIGTWSDNFNPGQDITDRSVVEKVQAALGRLGYDIGTPDGLMGPRTREAIEAFERETGMSESGSVNPRLLAVLGSQPV